MSSAMKIDKMSIPDKLQAIELIWNSLRHDEKSVPPPDWHQKLLEKRSDKNASFLDWNLAKQRMRSKIK